MENLMENQNVLLARAFLNAHRPQFDTLAETDGDSFSITVKSWDTFLLGQGLMTMSRIPDRGTPEWSHHVVERNKYRKSLNSAAQYGMHGDPAYRIDFDKETGRLRVRNLNGIVLVTPNQMAKQIESLIVSKSKGFGKMLDYIKTPEVLEQLPVEVRMRLRMHDVLFKGHLRNLVVLMNEYRENVEEDYRDVQRLLGRERQQNMLT
jgi:hypothetical protein